MLQLTYTGKAMFDNGCGGGDGSVMRGNLGLGLRNRGRYSQDF